MVAPRARFRVVDPWTAGLLERLGLAARGHGPAGARARRAAPRLARVDGRRAPRAAARAARAGAGGGRAPRRWRSIRPSPATWRRRGPTSPAAWTASSPGCSARRSTSRGVGTATLERARPGDLRRCTPAASPRSGCTGSGRIAARGRAAGARLQPGVGRGLALARASGRCVRERAGVGIACFPTVGGSGVAASQLAMQLAARGHRVHVFSSAVPVRLAGDGPVDGAPGGELAPGRAPGRSGEPLALARAMAEVSARESLDLLHVHYALPQGPAALLARDMLHQQGRDAPALVTTLHGTDVTGVGTRRGDARPGPRRGARKRRGPHPVGVALPRWRSTRSRCPRASGWTWCPNFVDPEAFHPLDNGAGEVPAMFPELDWSPERAVRRCCSTPRTSVR